MRGEPLISRWPPRPFWGSKPHERLILNGFILGYTSGNTTHEIKLEEFEMKEETVILKEEILTGSTAENTCTVLCTG